MVYVFRELVEDWAQVQKLPPVFAAEYRPDDGLNHPGPSEELPPTYSGPGMAVLTSCYGCCIAPAEHALDDRVENSDDPPRQSEK